MTWSTSGEGSLSQQAIPRRTGDDSSAGRVPPLQAMACHTPPPSGGGGIRWRPRRGCCAPRGSSVGEAPFVVVPGHHLDQCGVHHPGQLQVDDRGTWVANNIGGDKRILRYTENPLVLL